jgi:LppP/LprE lipoprotein
MVDRLSEARRRSCKRAAWSPFGRGEGAAMKRCALLFSAALLAVGATQAPAATPGGAWIEAKPIAGWNKAGAALPTAPKGGDQLARCKSSFRSPETKEDHAVAEAGWKLFAPYELFDHTAIVLATSDVDGMCRPAGYQAFVFVAGAFAGTLSPLEMSSRADGALQQPYLFGANEFSAEFERYADADALCCPSRTSLVQYRIERHGGHPLVVATSATTSANAH